MRFDLTGDIMLNGKILTASRSSLVVTLITVTALLGIATSKAFAQPDGVKALFIGHSFFRPFAQEMPFHATQAGIVGHTQNVVFRGGANGAPEALWNDPVARAEIQGYLDAGDVELFGMTIHGDYPGLTGYINWFDYALAQNPDTRFMLALPWLPQPASYTAPAYASAWHATHAGPWHDFVDAMRALYPNVEIFCNPYGQSALELRLLLDVGNLPGVTAVQGPAATSIHTDTLGHAGDILEALGELVWLNVIYGVDLLTYSYSPPWATDLNAVAQTIMDAHNAEYGAPDPGCGASPRVGCRTAAKSILLYKDNADDDKDRLVFKWIKGQATSQAEFGVPAGTAQYDLCLYAGTSAAVAGTSAALIAELNVPPDAEKWDPIGTKGYKYKDKLLSQDGTQRIVLKGSDAEKAKIIWKGKGTALPDLPTAILPLAPNAFPLVVQISNSETQTCFETSFQQADLIKNLADKLKLKQK